MGPGAMARSLGHFYEEDRQVQLGEEDNLAELCVCRVRGTLEEKTSCKGPQGAGQPCGGGGSILFNIKQGEQETNGKPVIVER